MYNTSIHKHFPEMGQMQLSCLNSMASPPNQLIIIRNSWKPHWKDSINISLWSWEILLTCVDMHSIFNRNKSFYKAFVEFDTHMCCLISHLELSSHMDQPFTQENLNFGSFVLDTFFIFGTCNIICERTLSLANSHFRYNYFTFFRTLHLYGRNIHLWIFEHHLDLEKCDLDAEVCWCDYANWLRLIAGPFLRLRNIPVQNRFTFPQHEESLSGSVCGFQFQRVHRHRHNNLCTHTHDSFNWGSSFTGRSQFVVFLCC